MVLDSKKPDRSVMLKSYLDTDAFRELSGLSQSDIDSISFGKISDNSLTEALKKLVFSFCEGDTQVTILRKVNLEIAKQASGENV